MSLAVLACGAATAQNTPYKAVVGTYVDASGALAVSDPSTSVAVDLIVEKEQTVVGPYARYAQKFLNMRGSLVDKTVYSLKGVKLAVTGGEDVIADAVPAAEVTETSYMGSASEFAKVLPDRMSATAVSEEEAAANAAQAIFSIRKHRMDLITGEAGENVFGAGLKDALAALDAAEQEYLELFFGKRVVTTSVERIVVPMVEGVQSYAVARVSASAGVVAADASEGDVVTLVERAQEQFDEEQARKLKKKLAKNQFTISDFYDQIQQVKKMGNIKDLASMIPGMGKALKDVEIKDDAFKGIEAIILSMTPAEREKPEIINGSRRKRIADGSGTSLAEVNRLLKQFEDTRKVMKNVMTGNVANMMRNMRRR